MVLVKKFFHPRWVPGVYKHSLEVRKKMHGRKPGTYHHSLETIEKIKLSNRGKKRSEGARLNISMAHMGQRAWNKGLPCPQLRGERHWNWQGGKIEGRRSSRAEYRHWRTEILIRDGFRCQDCMDLGGRLEVHHIKPYSRYPELRLDINNGVTLCKNCHIQTDSYGIKVSREGR